MEVTPCELYSLEAKYCPLSLWSFFFLIFSFRCSNSSVFVSLNTWGCIHAGTEPTWREWCRHAMCNLHKRHYKCFPTWCLLCSGLKFLILSPAKEHLIPWGDLWDVMSQLGLKLGSPYSHFLFFSRFLNSCFYLALGSAHQTLSLDFSPVGLSATSRVEGLIGHASSARDVSVWPCADVGCAAAESCSAQVQREMAERV